MNGRRLRKSAILARSGSKSALPYFEGLSHEAKHRCSRRHSVTLGLCVACSFCLRKAIVFIVDRLAAEQSLYDATRFAWRISRSKAERAEIILPAVKGVIRG